MMRDETTRAAIRRGATAILLATLCACQGTQKASAPEPEEETFRDALQIGNIAKLLRTSPDEFSVLTKRPLEMPQDFAALPAPEPGRRSSREFDPQADARAALAFDPVPASTGGAATSPSATEAAILASAGAADPNIRATLATEQAAYEAERPDYLLYRIFPSMRAARGELYPDAISAEEERVRLLEAGVTPRRTPDPVASAEAAPVQAVPVATAPPVPVSPVTAGPVLAAPEPRGVPTLGVLAPEPPEAAPALIYLPE